MEHFLTLETTADLVEQNVPSIKNPPELELKQLPVHLEYAYLEERHKLHGTITTDLSGEQRCQIMALLKKYQKAIA